MKISKALSNFVWLRRQRANVLRRDGQPLVVMIKQIFLQPLCLASVGFALSSCSDLSKSKVNNIVAQFIANETDETWCLNTNKLKTYKDGLPLSLQAFASSLPSSDQNPSFEASSVFPLIFSEEQFIPWNDQDLFIMELLIGGNYIGVHSGGYPDSSNEPGQPGDIYTPENGDQVDAIIQSIREKGAVVELSARGAAEGVWSPSEGGFCVHGTWVLNQVTGWTVPSTNQDGQIVTQITASKRFVFDSVGTDKSFVNPMSFQFITTDLNFQAVKFNNGWRVVSEVNSDAVDSSN